MTTPQPLSLDLTQDTHRSGFRLYRMEVLNWGTFDQHVWKIAPEGYNSLLTGDIGSGKSTLVDAITTLLVPAQRITYNKAAGAEGKERSLYSYVRGEYKSEKSELTQAAKAVALRDESHYSVLLAWFYNPDYQQGFSIAQVFWLKDGQRTPERLYIIAERDLNIATDFSAFGSDISALRKRFQKQGDVQVLDTFKAYASRFRRAFGIQSEQALELFYQTVSMKSVGNLTDFVRTHMLEDTGAEQQINNLRQDFDNLNRLHTAVIKARTQIDKLTPLVADLDEQQTLEQAVQTLRAAREALAAWFAGKETELLSTRLYEYQQDVERLDNRHKRTEQTIQNLRQQESDLHGSIEDQGGRRLREIERELQSWQREQTRTQALFDRWRGHCAELGWAGDLDEPLFYQNRQRSDEMANALEQRHHELQTQRDTHRLALHQQRQQYEQLQQEIQSLRQRKSNIPLRNLSIRAEMLAALGLDEDELQFAGELLQVDAAEREWEGAIERVLHNFGLSLLVPERHYERVSQYVEQTHLKGRLVYFRTQDKPRRLPDLDAASLVRKLKIKPDSEFYAWLEQALAERFDYHCAEDMTAFRRHPQALTRNGQIKAGGQRHEKDDRFALYDRSRYILGWSNRDKLAVLESSSATLEKEIQSSAAQIASIEKALKQWQAQHNALRDLLQIRDFSEIDWQTPSQQMQQLREEQQRIESASDALQNLQQQLQQVTQQRQEAEHKLSEITRKQGELSASIRDLMEKSYNSSQLAQSIPAETLAQHRPLLEQWQQQVLGETEITLRNIAKSQSEVRQAIQQQLDSDNGRDQRLRMRIVQQMESYRRDYPTDTSEADASLEAAQEYRRMLQQLRDEDLPRHEQTFKSMLNEQTIQGLVILQNKFEKELQAIQDKVESINRSLHAIEYNDGSYIRLVTSLTSDPEIRDFRAELRQCLSHALDSSNDLYTEERFLQVKRIIERFNGREGFVDQDKKWTRKVTDVRHWYLFSASERWREDDSEREFYSDSAGKSGGQKEKLAYTVLASALAYQFGLEWGGARTRSFRFVVIDEAFGRGSDESTRYALELFRRLNLQLLIVTPLQKIHVIEDYIHGVHFVHNEGGQRSLLRNLSIAEYRRDKAAML